MREVIENCFLQSIEAKRNVVENCIPDIESAANLLINALKDGKKVLVAGNGGSASQASHFAGELVGRFEKERRGLPCIALTTDNSVVTAWTNDYDFESLFERQVDSFGKEGDIFFGISTSGNSGNVIKACNKAKELGMKNIVLLGRDGGKMKDMDLDCKITVPHNNTARIQESHITIIHILCKLIEEEVFT